MQQVSRTGIKRHHDPSALVHLYWIRLIFLYNTVNLEQPCCLLLLLERKLIMKKSKNDGRDKMDKKLFKAYLFCIESSIR